MKEKGVWAGEDGALKENGANVAVPPNSGDGRDASGKVCMGFSSTLRAGLISMDGEAAGNAKAFGGSGAGTFIGEDPNENGLVTAGSAVFIEEPKLKGEEIFSFIV